MSIPTEEKLTGEELLREQLMAVAVGSGLTCREVLSALGYVRTVLKDKGDNLLDAANIQEVAKQERRKSVEINFQKLESADPAKLQDQHFEEKLGLCVETDLKSRTIVIKNGEKSIWLTKGQAQILVSVLTHQIQLLTDR